MLEFDNSTLANMTAALDHGCKMLSGDLGTASHRKRIADAIIAAARSYQRSLPQLIEVAEREVDGILAGGDAKRWLVDPEARKQIDGDLTERGYPPSEVLAQAYVRAAAQIDTVERRIASYEMRKMVILRELERRNDRLSRQLQKASSEVLDAEFSEAAE